MGHARWTSKAPRYEYMAVDDLYHLHRFHWSDRNGGPLFISQRERALTKMYERRTLGVNRLFKPLSSRLPWRQNQTQRPFPLNPRNFN